MTTSSQRLERFSDKVFVCEWTVDFGRIEERDAFFMGCTNATRYCSYLFLREGRSWH